MMTVMMMSEQPGGTLTPEMIRQAMDKLWNETRMPLPLASDPDGTPAE
jgi:hypothetical protein